MSWDEQRTELRVAIFRADGSAVVAQLGSGAWPDHTLQLIGDGVLTALDQGVPGAQELAGSCAEQLAERGWDGDRDLAAELLGRIGDAEPPDLKPLPVDLEDLAGALEGDPLECGGRLDLTNGEVWRRSMIEYAREEGEEDDDASDDPDRWLWIDGIGSHPGYDDMQDFIGTIDDSVRRDRLSVAIGRRGAFRRFKDVLDRWPGELDRWYAFAEDRQRGRARKWLCREGYRAVLPSFTG